MTSWSPRRPPVRMFQTYFLADDQVERDKQIAMLVWAPTETGAPVRHARRHDIPSLLEANGIDRAAELCLIPDDEIAAQIDRALDTYEVQRMKATRSDTKRSLDAIILELKARQRRPGKTTLVRIEVL